MSDVSKVFSNMASDASQKWASWKLALVKTKLPANFLAVFALDVSIFTALALFLAVGGRHG